MSHTRWELSHYTKASIHLAINLNNKPFLKTLLSQILWSEHDYVGRILKWIRNFSKFIKNK